MKANTITLENSKGAQARFTNYGAKLISLHVPDRDGKLVDVVLGYDKAEDYPNGDPYFGASVGRYANRIAKGKFNIDGTDYQLAINNGENALHGGPQGFSQQYWDFSVEDNTVRFTYLSPDMEEGYPGNMNVEIAYTLTEANELVIDYTATTDKPTVINLTHHSFFNLKGEGEGDILDHELQINAGKMTPSDETQIPTGEIVSVEGTPFDFREFHSIGERIEADNEQLRIGIGYDHNYVLEQTDGLKLAATLREASRGITMDVLTTEPAMQLYSGNWLGDRPEGKNGRGYIKRGAVCLETQNFPDAPNKVHFPNAILRPGEEHKSQTIYRFGTYEG